MKTLVFCVIPVPSVSNRPVTTGEGKTTCVPSLFGRGRVSESVSKLSRVKVIPRVVLSP